MTRRLEIEVTQATEEALAVEVMHQGLNKTALFNRAMQIYAYLNRERRGGWEVHLVRRRSWLAREVVVLRWDDLDDGDVVGMVED